MSEAQPSTVALEKSNLASLRETQYKDQFGNFITDPDRSNPTRPRLERPLDTIRSFEAAIDGSYSNRRMSYVTDAPTNSRPGSYYGGHGGYGPNNYSDAYNGRGPNSRPESYVDYGGSNGYNNGHGGYNNGQNGHYPYNQHGQRSGRPRYNQHVNPDHANGTFYPNSTYQRSNDNVTAGSGSANTDQWGNSTDPSSVNSSFDRLQQQQAHHKQEFQRPGETYGFNGFGAGPQIESSAQSNQAPPPPVHRQSNMNGYSNQGLPPAPPSKDVNASAKRPSLRKPVNSASPAAASSSKRTSWFKRRFSKND
jgi:hypothetical protein